MMGRKKTAAKKTLEVMTAKELLEKDFVPWKTRKDVKEFAASIPTTAAGHRTDGAITDALCKQFGLE